MSTLRQCLLDLLAIGRVANLPTVWSNLLLGIFLGFTVPDYPHGTLFWHLNAGLPHIILALAAVSCAYLCGTFLNDWKDAEFDRQHRPERAIPAHRFSRESILALGITFGASALLLLGVLSMPVLVAGIFLIAFILLYTWIHKLTPLAIIPMGLCRTCVYLVGFLVVTTNMDWSGVPGDLIAPSKLMNDPVLANKGIELITMGLGILVYIAGLTLAARYESRPEGMKAPRALFWFLLFTPFLTHTWWWLFQRPPFLGGWHLAIPVLCGLAPFVAWTIRALVILKKSIPEFVSRTLAGLCLVDLLAFPGLAATINSPWPAINSHPLLLALLPLSLFLLALLLQRLAPAT